MKHATDLNFGDPTELPADKRNTAPDCVPDVSALLPWKTGELKLREAVIYGAYEAAEWRLDNAVSIEEKIRRAVTDFVNHTGVALISRRQISSHEYKTVLWQMVEVAPVAGMIAPHPGLYLAFAAKCRLPIDAVGRDIRDATKCYVGCLELAGSLGRITVCAEEKRLRTQVDGSRVVRIDGTRVVRCTGIRPQFYFAPWRKRDSVSDEAVIPPAPNLSVGVPATPCRRTRTRVQVALPQGHIEALAALQTQATVAAEMLKTFLGPDARTSAARKRRRQLRVRLLQAQLVMGHYRLEVDTIIGLAARNDKTIPELTPGLLRRLLSQPSNRQARRE